MKRSLLVLGLSLGWASLGMASAAPIKLGSIPVSVESSPKLLVLTEAGILRAYPSAAGRPDAVFQTEDRKVSVSFEWRNGKLAANEVEKLAVQFPPVIKAQIPNVKMQKSGTVNLAGQPWAQFVFTLPGKNDDMRREMLITNVWGRVFVMTIAANAKDYARNEAVIRTLENSVRIDPS